MTGRVTAPPTTTVALLFGLAYVPTCGTESMASGINMSKYSQSTAGSVVWTAISQMASSLPTLLPQKTYSQHQNVSHLEWKPKRYLTDPQPPPQDESKLQEEALANVRLMIDGKLIKKTRPRRTVDYNGGMGRWALVRTSDAAQQVKSELTLVLIAQAITTKPKLHSLLETCDTLHCRCTLFGPLRNKSFNTSL